MWGVWRGAGVALALCAGLAGAWAGPAEDHAAGLKAYQQGDVVTAMSALRGAAKAGHAPSQALLAFILDRADFVDEAAVLWRAAADQNDAEGHAGLANAYLTGRGLAKDEKLARLHFSKAAELGHVAARQALDKLQAAPAPAKAASK